MSEFISSSQNFDIVEEASRTISNRALLQIDQTYGSGYPLWTPASHELAFHNGHHGRAVQANSRLMAEVMGLRPALRAIASAAGACHDIVQLKGRGFDEAESAVYLAAAMSETGAFSSAEQQMGKLAILGTQPLFDEQFNLIGQVANEQEYASPEAELLAKSVASGDLGELLQPQGPLYGHLLYREINGMPAEDQLNPAAMVDFQAKHVQLVNSYRYPLAEAEQVLATHRPEVIDYSEHVLEQMQAGRLETWAQLIAQDEAFMRQLI